MVPLSQVGRHATLNLRFSNQRGRTVIRESYCEVPFKVTRLHESSSFGLAHLILMHSSAGVFGGDVLDSTIQVESGARVLLTQQASTKVHPAGAKCAELRQQIRVEPGGELHVLNDPIIPFAGSRLHQVISIDLERDSRVYLWESFMAGRVGFGEVWQFDEFSSETSLRLCGQLIHLERFRLLPKLEGLTTTWVMSGARYVATALAFDERTLELADRLHESIPAAGVDMPITGLTVVRVVADDGPGFHFQRSTFFKTTMTFAAKPHWPHHLQMNL
jgi:urease accessory protein